MIINFMNRNVMYCVATVQVRIYGGLVHFFFVFHCCKGTRPFPAYWICLFECNWLGAQRLCASARILLCAVHGTRRSIIIRFNYCRVWDKQTKTNNAPFRLCNKNTESK